MTRILCFSTLLLLVAWPAPLSAQDEITSPREQFGFDIGDDYQLANYTAFVEYWTTLAQESPRMELEEIGRTAEGRPQLMAIITSPANQRRRTYYRGIARRLALAEDLTDRKARELAEQGKAVVWIDGGLHATEVLGAHQLMQLVYELVSQDDPETERILNDVIILATHVNPDGMELVSNWYMREPDPEKRSTLGLPRLYHKYVGHDNNRDFFLSSQPETENINRILYREWFPQIVYNHHQTGPSGTVMFAPPFRDPFNYNYDPLLPLSIEMVGAAMHSRFVAEGKPGTTKRSGASYSTWWNGGLRTTPYFHNMIGLLTETIGHPTPIEIPFILDRQLPKNDITAPIAPQCWHFRQSVEYSMTANRAVLDYASRYRETLLYNIYLMGRNAIERGSRDSWTVHPKRIDAVRQAVLRDSSNQNQANIATRQLPAELYEQVLLDPNMRDPRGYILPADQADFSTVTKFVNALIKNGVLVHQAERSFVVEETRYPKGSYVVKTAQAFRPFVLDMFEPQDHPNDFAYPGGPPIPPYDNAGWTLAYQMGVAVDRILDGFDGPFKELTDTVLPIERRVATARGAAGFLLSHKINDAATVTNRLLASNEEVFWLTDPLTVNGVTHPAGTIYIRAQSSTRDKLEDYAKELGIDFFGVRNEPDGGVIKLRPVRVGLWDRYGGSMPSGWTRWILEQFEFPFDVVYPQELDNGDLAGKYDVLVFVNGAFPREDREDGGSREPDAESIPAEYRSMLGRVTVEKTVPQLRQFLESGGTIITIGSSTRLAYYLDLAVTDHLVNEDGASLDSTQYYMPGSIHRIRVDNTLPIAYGFGEHVNVHFSNSPVFDLESGAEQQGMRRVGWFDSDAPLLSGWAWGQQFLEDGTTVVEADVGAGTLYLFGPEIVRRGQPHGSFKFLFNGIHLAGASLTESTTTTGSNEKMPQP